LLEGGPPPTPTPSLAGCTVPPHPPAHRFHGLPWDRTDGPVGAPPPTHRIGCSARFCWCVKPVVFASVSRDPARAMSHGVSHCYSIAVVGTPLEGWAQLRQALLVREATCVCQCARDRTQLNKRVQAAALLPTAEQHPGRTGRCSGDPPMQPPATTTRTIFDASRCASSDPRSPASISSTSRNCGGLCAGGVWMRGQAMFPISQHLQQWLRLQRMRCVSCAWD